MIINVLVQGIIISVISIYVQKFGLNDTQRDDFYNTVIML